MSKKEILEEEQVNKEKPAQPEKEKPKEKKEKKEPPKDTRPFGAKYRKNLLILLAIFTALFIITSAMIPTINRGTITLQEFKEFAEQDKIDYVVLTGTSLDVEVVFNETEEGIPIPEEEETEEADAVSSADGGEVAEAEETSEATEETAEEEELVPRRENLVVLSYQEFQKLLTELNIEAIVVNSNVGAIFTLLSILPTIIIVGLFYVMMKKSNLMGGESKNDAESRLIKTSTRFSDVAGLNEEKEELKQVVDTLKNPDKYTKMGSKSVKGVLLEGPPGVGKTLLAKAVAGEAGVPFLSYSASEFVQIYAGMGAMKIRSMYDNAEKHAPCVIFIDEIDALGRERGMMNSHQEAEQTLNALLEKMDGINTKKPILFMAATNRADQLDKALLRPGRFDKTIHIGPPSSKEDRQDIVRVHLRGKTLEEGFEVEEVSKSLFGLTGAEIEEVLNDAVRISFKKGGEGVIRRGDIDDSVMKMVAKGLAKGRHTGNDRIRVAYHELGHALMTKEVGKKVVKVSIQPYSGGLGGYTMSDGDDLESQFKTKQDIENEIKVLYSGRAAEQVFLGDISTGASSDLDRATQLLNHLFASFALEEGEILTYQTLAKSNPALVSSKELLEKMNKKGLEIYQEVVEYFEQPEVKERVEELKEELLEKETIYTI